MLARAEARASGLGLTVDLRPADAQHLPFEDGAFDTAVSTLTLCSIPDDRRAIEEVFRVLRPGGRFVLVEHVRSHDRPIGRSSERWTAGASARSATTSCAIHSITSRTPASRSSRRPLPAGDRAAGGRPPARAPAGPLAERRRAWHDPRPHVPWERLRMADGRWRGWLADARRRPPAGRRRRPGRARDRRAGDPVNLTAFPAVARLAAVGVGAAIAVSGMVAWERRPGNPIGPLLVLSGALWILARLQGAEWPVLALAAALANAISQWLLVVVLIAFPSGRITSRAGWGIVAFAAVAMVGLTLTTTITTELRRGPVAGGPNPLYVPLEPTLRSAHRGMFQVATYLVAIIGIAWLVNRWRRSTGPARRTFLPVFLAGAAIGAITLVGELVVNSGTLSTAEFQAVIVVEILSFALFPAAILAGVLRDRMARGAVADLVVDLGATPAPERLRDSLAGALGDPTLEVVYWSPTFATYLDANGVPVDLEADAGGRAVTHLERGGAAGPSSTTRPSPRTGLVAAVGAAVRLAVDNERLAAESAPS
jgi:SAM-dependent methyltransferase